MQKLPFDKVARGLDGDIVISREAPFGSFSPAGGLRDLYERIAAQQAKEGAVLLSGFVFGGSFADLGSGRVPKDYDVYLASPNMVRAMRAFQCGDLADDDFMNDDEWAEAALGYDFPIKPHSGLSPLKKSDVIGDYYEFNGNAMIDGKWHKIDVKIGTKNVSMADFIRHFSAPVMAASMALDRDNVFAYHEKCVDHATRRIMCTDKVTSPDLVEKAKRKGYELITPAALAERDKGARATAGVHVSKNGEWRAVI